MVDRVRRPQWTQDRRETFPAESVAGGLSAHGGGAHGSVQSGHETALAELKRGRKSSHWIWYIFPQLVGLGHSSMSRVYGVSGLEEVTEYLRQPELRARLIEITTAVQEQLAAGNPLVRLIGGETDALKLVSSLTLFDRAARDLTPAGTDAASTEMLRLSGPVLAIAETQGFPRCAFALRTIAT